MPSRRCSDCDACFKTGSGRVHCPFCGEALSFSAILSPDTPWPGEPLPPLEPEVEQLVSKGWHELKIEAEKRGVSQADVLELRDWAA
jgi:hypothetical protein